MDEEREREGVATTLTNSGSVIHHPGPRPGVGVEGLVGYFDLPTGDGVLRDTSGSGDGSDVPPSSDNIHHAGAAPEPETETKTETEGGYDTAPSSSSSPSQSSLSIEDSGGGGDEDEPSIADLLLLSHSPAHPITVKGAEAWELELGETVKRAGMGGSGVGVVRTGRGRKVRAGGKSVEENDGDEDEGKGLRKTEWRRRETKRKRGGKGKRRRRRGEETGLVDRV